MAITKADKRLFAAILLWIVLVAIAIYFRDNPSYKDYGSGIVIGFSIAWLFKWLLDKRQ